MSLQFALRTLRNVVLHKRPYFAHLALTHRCNLRCRFCRIHEEKFAELDTAGMCRVIDVLDRLGIAVLSVSGGGEPLLRKDVPEILNYAGRKGLYTKLTSNGTLPQFRYRELLDSRLNEIGISLDGVEGNDLPFSHTGPRILETIRYLNDHLPPGKSLTLNVTVSEVNHHQVDRIVAYCAREFSNARVWLNPVVTGSGLLRSGVNAKLAPDYLDRLKSPTLLKAPFYTAAVWRQYRNDRFDWGCEAGRMFFDIKPDGDLWLCQDQAPIEKPNILQPDFLERFRALDVSRRRACSGCTYSCYFLTQKAFDPANWRDMGLLWWAAATSPNAPCRAIGLKHGPLAGLASYLCGGGRSSNPAANSAII
jgi:MoaA/NifB/PqqE/SkfB family radical SAM enzyme